jgi:putative transposase
MIIQRPSRILCKPPNGCKIRQREEVFSMPKRKELTPEEKMRKEFARQLVATYRPKTAKEVQDIVRDMFADVLQESLEGELEEELGYSKYDYRNKQTSNSRNGHSSKTVRSSAGEIELEVPRDRDGEYEPQIIPKHQTTMPNDLEERVLSMYAKGMTTGDIESHLHEIYGVEASDSMISRITDKILPVVRDWQKRPLEDVYAVVFIDAIHYSVRKDGNVVKKAVYVIIGINPEGIKDVLGLWVGENESARFWAGVLNELRNRGVEDILIACMDNLAGLADAFTAAYPQTEIQQCILHQIRSSTRHVSYKDIDVLMADLKRIYQAPSQDLAASELDRFEEIWRDKYPRIAKSWRENWLNLSTFFKYPPELRTLIYTTNAIEGFNRQLRKVTKNRGVFPTDDSLLKMLYLAMIDITKKWTGRRKDWGQIRAQLELYFGDRMPY